MAERESIEKQFLAPTIISFILSVALLGFGFWFGQANFNLEKTSSGKDDATPAERLKILFPVCAGFFLAAFPWVINTYLKQSLEQAEKKMRNDLLKQNRSNEEVHRKVQELEFLSYLRDADYPFSQLDYGGFTKPIQELRSKQDSKLNEAVNEYKIKLQARQESVRVIEENFNFQRSQRPLSEMQRAIVEACNSALELDSKSSCQDAYPFYNDIQAYLAAWLKCSVKYDVVIPIEPFFQEKLSGQAGRRYKGKESYKKAFLIIKDEIFNRQEVVNLFSSESLEITRKYLGELINILEGSSVPIS